ncbi:MULTISPECIES: MurR/RpiR family transcriptional regulator [unclassified Enterococcus]|uniref:MurR/RpiR family transcriptional regulator n=1 Tax=unclassified Enterococcus TaxID=2608891 RepID=UPI001CE224EC|nr:MULTISPECIES: MurR/RpiR family transcriptional regulator [unclassified Enterococcus]MCA5012066.1 MurR/RpiR family transcriptional regulator [Enterococcus sp. S23]MCA5015317.1 MurR/RpiR family transcriptional regulator [Enterococcus sp. S22(2020)]
MEKASIVGRLQDLVISTTEGNINTTIARTLLKKVGHDAADISIESLAEECYTSTASISRFSKKLGYSKFSDMQQAFVEYQSDTKRFINKNNFELTINQLNSSHSLNEYIKQITQSFQSLEKNLDLEQVDLLCERIHSTEDVYFFGTHSSGLLLEQLQYLLFSCGKYVTYFKGRMSQRKAFQQISKNSLVIILSTEGNYFLKFSDLLFDMSSNDNYTVLITQNDQMKIANIFDEVFFLGNSAIKKAAPYQAQLFIDILYSRYYQLYSQD